MLKRSLGCLLLVSAAVACGGSPQADEAASAASAFSTSENVGRAKKTFTTPNGVTEVCIVPKHFQEEGYSGKDTKKEDKLCSIDWNAGSGDEGKVAAALLPKANSTNPATDIMKVTDSLSRSAIETQDEANAGSERQGEKLGRFKSSLDSDRFGATTSYAPSIVGYYGTSRLLGGIAEVVPAVWRTMELSRHAKVAKMGSRLSSGGTVKRLWEAFVEADDSPSGNLIYTSDQRQLYGALIPSVSGDEKDSEIDTYEGLSESSRFANLAKVARLDFVPRDFSGAVKGIVPMQGITEMLVLDPLMLQSDRLSGSNVSYIPYVYFNNDGQIETMTQKEYDKVKAEGGARAGAVAVRKLFLNDVDAGFVDQSTTSYRQSRAFKLLGRIAHISPDLYARVRRLSSLVQSSSFESFTKSEWRFSQGDFDKYKIMAGIVATLLHDRCVNGDLFVDLSVRNHVAGKVVREGEGCE